MIALAVYLALSPAIGILAGRFINVGMVEKRP
jgi:hypothetical protein